MIERGTVKGHAHRARKRPVRIVSRPTWPTVAFRPHPIEWETATVLAGGDKRRLLTVEDGVLVLNSHRRPSWCLN